MSIFFDPPKKLGDDPNLRIVFKWGLTENTSYKVGPTSYKQGDNSTYGGYNPSYPFIRPLIRAP